MDELKGAIQRRLDEYLTIDEEWLSEYNKHIIELTNRHKQV